MGSSLGGFLVGVGVTLLAFSLAALYLVLSVYVPLYDYALKYKPYLLEARRLLTSPEAEKLASAYSRIVREVEPDDLEVFAQETLEIIHNIENITENPLLGGNMSVYLAKLNRFSSMYNSSYSKLEQLQVMLDEVGAWVKSPDFNVTLETLAMLASEDSQSAVGAYAEDFERAYIYLQSLREFYFSARKSLSELYAPNPQELRELLNTLESFKSIEADIQQMRAFLDDAVRFLSSEDFKGLVEAYRELRNTVPPEKLQEMLIDAQLALDKAVEAVNVVESFPPDYVLNVIYALIAFEAVLSLIGLFLCLKARDRDTDRRSIEW